jgi:hypothetical protein
MPTHPILRTIVKILSVVYLVSALSFMGFTFLYESDASTTAARFGFMFLSMISSIAIIPCMVLTAILGTIDLWNRPRSYFTATITILNWLVIILIIVSKIHSEITGDYSTGTF